MSHDSHKTTYLKVWGGLLILTVITVTVSYFNFGVFNILVAMLVASVKAALVCLFFMHLIEDNRLNQVVFGSSFIFLAVFIALTASDLLHRPEPAPAKIDESAAGGENLGDVDKLLKSTPELVSKGQTLFQAQCSACHGMEGKGDGPAASALKPPPRDFTSGDWKLGGTPAQVFQAISNGSSGTAMPPFAGLSVADRFALAHYVRSLSPKHPDDSPETLKAAGIGGGSAAPAPQQRIPVQYVMEMMAKPAAVAALPLAHPDLVEQSSGAKIYETNCLSCHGAGGQGGVPVQRVGVGPFANLQTQPFSSSAAWFSNQSMFVQKVSQGIPGHNMPSAASLSPAEWSSLFQHVRSLAR